MRVLLTVPSSDARLYQLVPLGWALRTAGHDVQIAGPPAFADTIARTGFIAVPAGSGAGCGADRLADPAAVDDLAAFAAAWAPSLVVWDEVTLAGSVAARLAGAASVRMLGLDALTPGAEANGTAAAAGGPGGQAVSRLAGCLARHGLAWDAMLACGHVTLVSVPLSLGGPAGTGWLPAPVYPIRGRGGRPRLASADTEAAADLGHFRLRVEPPGPGLRGGREHRRRLVSTASLDQINTSVPLPDNVRLAESAPLAAVLPTCTAVIHDGTAPVAAAVLAYGLPQLTPEAQADGVAPRTLSRRIADYGAGLLMSPGDDARSLAGQIGALIADDTLRQHAGLLRKEVSVMPSPREIVPELVRLSAQRDGDYRAGRTILGVGRDDSPG